ncbi:hypothetical protein [Salinisphaera sp. Q1T1-3]|uniref:hypothetical protein n=1 Tax=Salinisphaera sp. Q1T1-3 TaxID=2321229 RepID=UPI000E725E26|nr:hypothetical protein [Salinisphaera sp. Q1T1-3]RJS94393.1 hypothetical protein D3260_04615 [Salinisphaera sp. Q1T1-3]
MHYKKILALATVLVVIIAGIGVALSYRAAHRSPRDGAAALVIAKKHQLAALDSLDNDLAAPDESQWNPLERDRTLRDSGRQGVGLFIRHAFFRVAGDIGFKVDTLSALLVPRDAGAPVILDDPSSFIFKPLHGDVVMPARALGALFNQYLTDYDSTQLRHLHVSTNADGTLDVVGQTQKVPGVWLPFEMHGPVRLMDGHLFVYTPDKIKIAKIPAKGLLKLIRLQMSQLVQIDTQGAELSGDSIVLDLNHALPPPEQDVHVSAMRIDSDGVHLSFRSPFDPEWPQPIVETDSYILLNGGDVKTFRSMLTHVRMQLVAADGGALDTSLYNYRQQIVGGHFDITPAGELVAHLATLETADYVPDAAVGRQDRDHEHDSSS